MQIAKNTVVEFHYTLSDANGEVESSRQHEPVLYLHGQPGLLDGLVEAMEGREAGDVFSVELPVDKAYGPRQDNATQKVQVKHLQGAKKWKPGMLAVIQTEQGPRQVTVVKVGLSQAEVDANHPLAGRDLTFDIEILSVREATAEELAHGHAHGVGGHQH
ncbi:MAG TPA: peptidylprolyl isomerase [Candidatus Pseudomonas excrementavium]|uniref:Peptidyl-prolyl cis-trans isomerase n=1 Tax=Halopseudomonas bauzanensis TaxID=653930 RepID=A0A1H9QQ22_9GAMM|nr:peptidylprolyl isomerase [Halopseudomonas bauzanensis]MCO5784887.1 peptidylprolyl isomerase [Pseudomonas sp. G11-1]MCO5789010.1 peptidylprolyl isomerase [Pseudomonas sp. G11-2]HIZ50843.1 peptidylprolyl isomerase [Candidatus Pseudomonas excrementavium]SER62325.1 FKBP-type peptidyl-prolyl cis-trans isomerase SlyD [Halopseudomonas bauzanensis]SFL64158.1 FKBP-type peptidyl-prolyl cis-trans isomerase SlyD [Halopseudomonas bauzanensis]